jgi:hypothetical protein
VIVVDKHSNEDICVFVRDLVATLPKYAGKAVSVDFAATSRGEMVLVVVAADTDAELKLALADLDRALAQQARQGGGGE